MNSLCSGIAKSWNTIHWPLTDRTSTNYITCWPHPHISHAETHARWDALYEPNNAANANRLRVVTNWMWHKKPRKCQKKNAKWNAFVTHHPQYCCYKGIDSVASGQSSRRQWQGWSVLPTSADMTAPGQTLPSNMDDQITKGLVAWEDEHCD